MRSYKDTVMSDLEIKEAVLEKCGVKIEVTDEDRAIAKAQEVIAHFKGYQEGLERGKKVGKKVGIRAMTEWIKEQNDVDDEPAPYYVMNKRVLEKQLKEVWGVFNA